MTFREFLKRSGDETTTGTNLRCKAEFVDFRQAGVLPRLELRGNFGATQTIEVYLFKVNSSGFGPQPVALNWAAKAHLFG
jgi:hypothetical protein